MNDINDPRANMIDGTTSSGLDASSSAVSWSAIFAGGVGAAAFSLILLTLGTGLGLTSLSPWTPPRDAAVRFGVAAIAWICVTEILTSGLGGYLAGRLRRRWTAVHVDETYFRDTAHGFLSWAVSTIVTAALLAWGVAGLAGAGVRAAADGAGQRDAAMVDDRGDADSATKAWPIGYYVDSLFRQPANATGIAPASLGDRAGLEEVTRIFLNSLPAGAPLAAEDARYAGQLVAQRTGLSQDAAQARVNMTYAKLQQKINAIKAAAKANADKARKAAIYVSLWLFVSLLMGAFSASLMATFGGRQRDL